VYTLRLEPNRQRQGNSAKIAGPQGSVIFFYIFLIVLDTVKGVSIFNSEILVPSCVHLSRSSDWDMNKKIEKLSGQ